MQFRTQAEALELLCVYIEAQRVQAETVQLRQLVPHGTQVLLGLRY